MKKGGKTHFAFPPSIDSVFLLTLSADNSHCELCTGPNSVPLAAAVQLSVASEDDPELPPAIPRSVREESIVVALRAQRADCDVFDSGSPRVRGDERAEVDGRGSRHRLAGELAVHIGAHLVAGPADGWPAVQPEIGGGEAELAELANGLLGDARRRASPARVQRGRWPLRMCDEDGHTIGHGHGHRRSTARAQMAVRLRSPQKALPLSVVMEDSVAVYLIRGGETGLSPADEDAQRRPTGGDVAHR